MSLRTCTLHHATHAFDEVSGWCVHGCGLRDDGLVIVAHGTATRRTATARLRRDPSTHSVHVPDITEPRHSRDLDEETG